MRHRMSPVRYQVPAGNTKRWEHKLQEEHFCSTLVVDGVVWRWTDENGDASYGYPEWNLTGTRLWVGLLPWFEGGPHWIWGRDHLIDGARFSSPTEAARAAIQHAPLRFMPMELQRAVIGHMAFRLLQAVME